VWVISTSSADQTQVLSQSTTCVCQPLPDHARAAFTVLTGDIMCALDLDYTPALWVLLSGTIVCGDPVQEGHRNSLLPTGLLSVTC
jgi:hypothetical protein